MYAKTLGGISLKRCGAEVLFLLGHKRKPNYTNQVTQRVNADKAMQACRHHVSVVEHIDANWMLSCVVHSSEELMNFGNVAVR